MRWQGLRDRWPVSRAVSEVRSPSVVEILVPMTRIIIERPEYFRRVTAYRAETPVILVRGTSHGEWADPGSPFRTQVLEPEGIVVAATVFGPERLLFPRGDWRLIGAELARLLDLADCHLLAHSHGLQVAALALAQTSAESLVSIAGPIRHEMREAYATAAQHCERVVQIAEAGTDWTQIGGQYFGRFMGISARDFPAAANVTNIRETGIGHSGLLYDAQWFDLARRLIVPALGERDAT